MTIDLGVLIALSGVIIAFSGFMFNRNKHTKDEVRANTKLETTLTHISKGVDDIRIEQKANEKHMAVMTERLTRVEESAKSAHRRIDHIKGGETIG